MTENRNVIMGCGDVGRRIVTQLIEQKEKPANILGLVRSEDSAARCTDLGIKAKQYDFDTAHVQAPQIADAECY
ncbi:MAG: NAD(P)-binding domain-containing protein, partial [Acidiferrobacterales bacterium]|nr:NAD(P)-binding domain-containing protein [Acidiferrobacterales bacterium]